MRFRSGYHFCEACVLFIHTWAYGVRKGYYPYRRWCVYDVGLWADSSVYGIDAGNSEFLAGSGGHRLFNQSFTHNRWLRNLRMLQDFICRHRLPLFNRLHFALQNVFLEALAVS